MYSAGDGEAYDEIDRLSRKVLGALAFLGWVQVMAVVINLLPVPGLDGWGGLEPYLPRRVADTSRRLAPFAFLVLFLLLFRVPAANHEMSAVLNDITRAFHVPDFLPRIGYTQVRFWVHRAL